MRCDAHPEPVGDVGHGRDLVRCHVCGADLAARIGDAAGDGDLDPLRTGLDLAACGFPELGRAVGLDGPLVVGTVASRRHEELARAEDTRPFDVAAIDRLLEIEVDVSPIADESHGRDAGPERLAAFHGHAEPERSVALAPRCLALPRQRETEVDVQVHETGKDPRPARANDVGAWRHGSGRGWPDGRDAIAIDDDDGIRERRPTRQVDEIRADDGHRTRTLRGSPLRPEHGRPADHVGSKQEAEGKQHSGKCPGAVRH